MTNLKEKSLEEHMFEKYGPIIGGKDLYSSLGFKTYSSFHRFKQLGEIGINVFILPGRRGWFAMTTDVATWLMARAAHKKIS